ncbi:hypothetical protein EX30DRAFT_396686 [Ascodesmis nigricans]|uniref:Uncharacterized protein n=1 Tax=Ascodesmis nigricans TaxID=341454 RepID=A0A4S2MTK8_9PEZI|nr:hypothetical protein EX30DRAFT_396686 [Ascodesmis nigricans]
MRFTAFVILALNTVAVSLADQKTNEAKPADEPMFALDIGYVPANGPQFAYIRYCLNNNTCAVPKVKPNWVDLISDSSPGVECTLFEDDKCQMHSVGNLLGDLPRSSIRPGGQEDIIGPTKLHISFDNTQSDELRVTPQMQKKRLIT